MILRIILILYIFPLMFLSAISMLFKKVNWVKYIWLYGTFGILLLIIFVKFLFSIAGIFE